MKASAVVTILGVGVFSAPRAEAQGDLSETLKYIGEYVPGDIEGLEHLIEQNPTESLAMILFKHGDISEDPYETVGSVRLDAAKLRPLILDAARKFDVPPALIDAVIRTESGYRPEAVSRVGARGLMQLMPATAREMGVLDAFDPKQNILGGTKYLRKMLDKFGSIPLAVAAYNAGPGAVLKHDGVPPFKETRGYVKTVMIRYKGSPFAKDQYRFDSNDRLDSSDRGRVEPLPRAPSSRSSEPESDGEIGDDLMRLVK